MWRTKPLIKINLVEALSVSDCTFKNNSALEMGGGALSIECVSAGLNDVTVQDTQFVSNYTRQGGALYFLSDQYKTDVNNRLQLFNCEFIGNSAYFGAAMSLRLTSLMFNGIPPNLQVFLHQ